MNNQFYPTAIGDLWYQVSLDGRIKKLSGKGFIKAFPDKDGYLKYALTQPMGTYNCFLHRLVWLLHYHEIPDDKTVDHIDGNKLNNSIENLQLLSPKANVVKGNAKTWRVVSPYLVETIVYNLEQFCKEHNLHAGHMGEVARSYKNQTHCKGWKCYVI